MSHTIKIQALDTLFFRDGKPFTMGDDTFASGIFPPPPSVFHGAICSACIAGDITKLDNSKLVAESIEIEGIFYLKETKEERLYQIDIKDSTTILLPTPLDIVQSKTSGNPFLNTELQPIHSNGLLKIANPYSEETENIEAANGFLEMEDIKVYLQEGEGVFYGHHESTTLTVQERKIGNGLNDTSKTTEEGHLYRLNMYRLEKEQSRLCFLIKTNTKPTHKWLRLGGEGKMAVWSDTFLDTHIPEPTFETDNENIYFKLYLATPSVSMKSFELDGNNKKTSGWLPDFDSFNLLTSNVLWKGISMQLITAFVGKAQPIGGFDMAAKSKGAKKMYRAIPAGSVYYFKLNHSADAPQLIKQFHGKSICNDETFKRQGFGIAYIGSLNPNFLNNDEQ